MARYKQQVFASVLHQANELIAVGRSNLALDMLQGIFSNENQIRLSKLSVLEPIMFKYLDLCVELKKSCIAREGLFQYRNMFQSVDVNSLKNVICHYLRMAEEKTNAVRNQSQQTVTDNFDNLVIPENILLSPMNGEDAQARSDHTILTPCVMFLWSSYCQCLELLRTNAQMETLYHDIARMAFQFCLEYNRKTEFRELCEKLRNDLEEICKLPALISNVSMNKAETQQLNLKTRLNQLDSAIQMELWQEAFKSAEDVHDMMNLSKKIPLSKVMANYYEKLAMVFWKTGEYLFHAAALFKLLQFSYEMKKSMSSEEKRQMANRTLLATLSISLLSTHTEFDYFETENSLEKSRKLVTLLGLSQLPSRISLLKDIVRLNVISFASSQLQELHLWLEVEFHPLELCNRIDSVIQTLQADENSPLIQYISALQDVTLVHLIHQISQVYHTIQFSRLLELAKFTTDFDLERLLVDCVRYNDMQIKINHHKMCVIFGTDLSEAKTEGHPYSPVLQATPSEQIRCQLMNMTNVLHRAINVINLNKKKLEREKLRSAMIAHYHETKTNEHQKILGRHKIIEKYIEKETTKKKYIEHINTIREEKEMRRQEKLQRQRILAEQKRFEQERERKRQQNEIQQIKDRHLKEKMQQISQTSHGQKVLKKLKQDEIKKLDVAQIAAREAEELQKEHREKRQKLKSQEKKVDYLERAKRLKEIPLLQKAKQEQVQQQEQLWLQEEDKRIAAAVEEQQDSVATKERLVRMNEHSHIFRAKILAKHENIYLEKLKDFEKLLNEKRTKRLLKRKMKRKVDRKAKWEKEAAEAIERKRLEELRIKQEEEKKCLEEERAKKEEEEKIRRAKEEAQEAERLAKLKKQAEISRAREAEIERKLEEERQRSKKSSSSWRRMDRDRDRDNSNFTIDSWRRNPDKDSNRFKNETEHCRERDDKIESSSWKRREPERHDMDKWRRNKNVDRSKKESVEKSKKEKNDGDNFRDRDKLENRRDELARNTNQDWRKRDPPQERYDRKDNKSSSRPDNRRRPIEDDSWTKVNRR